MSIERNAMLAEENRRLRAIILRAVHELPPPGFYGPGSVWDEMLEVVDET